MTNSFMRGGPTAHIQLYTLAVLPQTYFTSDDLFIFQMASWLIDNKKVLNYYKIEGSKKVRLYGKFKKTTSDVYYFTQNEK